MTIADALHAAQQILRDGGIDDADLEAEVLLRHALGLQRHQLFARLHEEIDGSASQRFDALLQRRLAHEPTAYIVSHREFYAIDLEMTPAALIPRPETELLVDEAIRLTPPGASIVDIGTGSGAIAIAVGFHLPDAIIYAIDESSDALALAARNAERHGVADRIRFLQGDLFAPLPEAVDVIVANLPYVPTSEWESLPAEIREHEPRQALDGGPTGTLVLERFLRESPRYLRPGGRLLAEIGWDEGERLRAIASECFPQARIAIEKDLAGLDRLLVVES